MKGLRLSGLSLHPSRSVTFSPAGEGDDEVAAETTPAQTATSASKTITVIVRVTTRCRPCRPFLRPLISVSL